MITITQVAVYVCLVFLSLSLALCLYRVVKGPSLADRVVALDMVAIISVGIVVTYAVESGHAIYLDATLIIASVSFLSTVAFGFFIEKGRVQ